MHNALRIALVLATTAGVSGGGAAEPLPRPEHPLPQNVRAEWLNLNGVWEFAETDDDGDVSFLGDVPYPDRIVVPFCRESRLSGLERTELVKNVWYRRSFTVPADWKSPRVRLHIGACDWRTRAWVNGQPVGEHVGGNVAFAFDITDALHPGENRLVIHAFDDGASGLQALGKQTRKGPSTGIFYTRTTGIWQTVWLEGVGASFIRAFQIDPDPKRECAVVKVEVDGPVDGLSIVLRAHTDAGVIGETQSTAEWRNNTLVLPVPNPRLWSVEDPFLYDLDLELHRGDAVVDSMRSYFGMRRITIEGAAILLNDKSVFQRLVLDQGFYPDGVWTAPTDADLRRDIELSQSCGFNGARLHQKVFEPRFLHWADRLGYLVWGEFPSFGADYGNPAVNVPIMNEWVAIVQRDRNHPSIIGWCPFNETPPEAGALQAAVVRMTRALDPSRPVIETSGWTHHLADPEVLDAHDYNQDPPSFRARWTDGYSPLGAFALPARYGVRQNSSVPFFISEYGGIGWAVGEGGWGYGKTPEDLQEFYDRFKGLSDALLDNRFIFGLCYTQLTDIEQEQNGLYAYDRTPKFDVAPLRAAMTRRAAYEDKPPVQVAKRGAMDWRVLVGSLHDGPNTGTWRYKETAPPEGWEQPGYNDGDWAQGHAPFGFKGGEWNDKIRTRWRTSDIWLRQEFTCDETAFDAAVIVLHHDDDTVVHLNGKRIWQRPRWNDGYEAFDVTEAVRDALLPGKNTLTVHVHQDKGGQYFDMAFLIGKAVAR